jgi:hypothetical protein
VSGTITVELAWPAKELSPNHRSRSHWPRTNAIKAAKEAAFWATRIVKPLDWKHDGSRLRLTITAYPPDRRARDDDNLAASLKAARDGIASALGVDDKLFDQQPIIFAEPSAPGKVVVEIGAGS